MTVSPPRTPAPVGQQSPPTRIAASAVWKALRNARGSLPLTTGTACTELDCWNKN